MSFSYSNNVMFHPKELAYYRTPWAKCATVLQYATII